MNNNKISIDGFSDPDSEARYRSYWPDEPELQLQHHRGQQCGGCSFYAPFNMDWGLCCQLGARHHLETVFEHYTCPSFVLEGWGPHSFSENVEDHCRCEGEAPPDQ